MGDLFLVSVEVSARQLVADARRRGQALRELDPGYLLHALVDGTFGPGRLRPFVVEFGDEAKVRLLAYAEADSARLVADAEAFASPDHWTAVDWSTLRSKPMPTTWTAGRRLGFRVRCCPVVRRSGDPEAARTRDGKAATGTEQDAWLAACRRAPDAPPPSRDDVYRGWLADQLSRSGAAKLEEATMTRFDVTQVHRRTQGSQRRPEGVSVPDATFRGTLEITDPAAFSALLARGVGRHRAFGFGMLLLESPRC